MYSFTWAHHPFTPVLQPHLPYNVAVIEIDGAPGVRMVSNVIDVSEAELVVGLRVAVTYEAVGDHVLPRFRRGNEVV